MMAVGIKGASEIPSNQRLRSRWSRRCAKPRKQDTGGRRGKPRRFPLPWTMHMIIQPCGVLDEPGE
jgi:hypothetical protein